MNKLPLFSTLLVGLVAAGSACADMIFYEPFDQTPGTFIKDDAEWTQSANFGGSDPDIVASTLTLTGVDTAGNKARMGLNGEGAYHDFSADVATDDSVYVSFLFQLDDVGNQRNDAQRFVHLYSTVGVDALGDISFEGMTGVEDQFKVAARVYNESYIYSPNLSTGVTYQLVLRYDHATTGNDNMEVWINPGSASTSPALWNATATDGAPGGGVDRLYLQQNEDWDNNSLLYIDEVVIADSWEDARNLSLVPEPGSFALVFSALLMVRFLRRRRT